VQGISDLITVHGLINLDFADVKTVMSNSGSALMGIGRASGDDRAVEAAHQAIESPLLEISIDGARGILFNVIGGLDMSMHEINAAAETITAAADPDANIIFGATISPEVDGEIIITVVATGFEESYYSNRQRTAPVEQKPVESGLSELASHDAEAEAELSKVAHGANHDEISEPEEEVTVEEVKDLDLDLDKPTKKVEPSADFKDETPLPNIWNFENEPEEDTFDKPSFLRRLTRRKKDDTTKDEDDK
jgi:hypothetical protein